MREHSSTAVRVLPQRYTEVSSVFKLIYRNILEDNMGATYACTSGFTARMQKMPSICTP